MNKIYPREEYLTHMRSFYQSDLIKVVTGIRRCGKSTLLKSVAQELQTHLDVSPDQITFIDLDKFGYKSIRKADELEQVIFEKTNPSVYNYLFIDEIQNVKDFEPVINAFREEGNYSIFVTGSNSYLLSGELATKLTGRHITFDMFPLNFYEYLEMNKLLDNKMPDKIEQIFENYIVYGGFPQTLFLENNESKQHYVQELFQQIIAKDIQAKRQVRNTDAFNRSMAFVINNFGSPVSVAKIAKHFSNYYDMHVNEETIARYLKLVENAKIINKCKRFDLKTKTAIGSLEKYYLADTSLYFAQSTDNRINYGPILENILYVYLRSKGYELSVGKIGNLECDFIARKNGEYAYIQVAYSIADLKTEDREYRPFEKIRDGYPRFLFTLDYLLQKRDGVKHYNLVDFMKDNRELF